MKKDEHIEELEKLHKVIEELQEKDKAQKLMMEELLSAKMHFYTMIQRNADAILILDKQGIITYVNPMAEELFSKKTKDLVGRPFGFPVIRGEKTEIDIIQKNGNPKIAEMNVAEIQEDNDEAFLVSLRDVTSRKQTEEKLRRELREKGILLREVRHRTKNNLQMLSGLLHLQAETIHNKEDALHSFEVSQDRIQSMARAYDLLISPKYISEVEVGEYLKTIAEEKKNNYDLQNKIQFEYSMEEVKFPAAKLTHIGVIINELITNAIKYAFKDRERGIIAIELKDAKDHITLKVSDNGVGISEEIRIPNLNSLGLAIVDMLMSGLGGTYSVDRNTGTSFTLIIPKVSES